MTTKFQLVQMQALASGIVQVQGVVTASLDGYDFQKNVSESYSPGDDLSEESDEVRKFCELWWTADRIAAYNELNGKDHSDE